MLRQPDWSGREYDFDQDPLWQHEVKPQPIDAIAWYQCDHLGTPMELTDHNGEVAWAGQYKAWGEVREVRSEWAKQVGMTNPIRFQGQYHDHETGLHYNRYRYYDPMVGRFVNQDPISYGGGFNLFEYAGNPIAWTDPLGLAKSKYNVGANTAGKDVLARGVHVNVDGPGLPRKGGHITLQPDADGKSVKLAPADKATRDMSPSQWRNACESISEHLDDSKNVDRLAKSAQAGIDENPKSNRVDELTKVKGILQTHHGSGTNPVKR